MAAKDEKKPLPPTVVQVFEKFIEAITIDDAIDNNATKRLGELIHKGDIPKPDDINEVLFETPEEKTGQDAS